METPQTVHARKIVCVGGTPLFREFLRSVAAELGWELLEADTGPDAVGYFNAYRREIDLGVYAWGAVGVNGQRADDERLYRELAARIRLLVVAPVTCAPELDKAGITDSLMKPCTDRELAAALTARSRA